MKKIAVIFLLFAMLTVFVSCGKDKDGETTTLSPYTGVNATTSQITDESTTAGQSVSGYVLTTDPNMTVSWGVTTGFSTTAFVAPDLTTSQVPSISDINSTAINPSMSQVSTTEKQTQNTSTSVTATGPTVVDAPDNTTKPADSSGGNTTEESESVTKEEKVVAFGSKSIDPDFKKVYIDFNANGWDGAIATRSTKVSVKFGSKTENAPCTIEPGVITVNVSGLELVSGMTITISFPEGAIATTSGSQYSKAASVSFGI